jgi:hypothetical protein
MVPPVRQCQPDDLKFLFRGENSVGADREGNFSELENGLPDYNPQLKKPCGFFGLSGNFRGIVSRQSQ